MAELTVANVTVQTDLAWRALVGYAASARDTLVYYDYAGGTASPGPHDGLSLSSFGRITFFEGNVRTRDAAELMRVSDQADWAAVPADTTLSAADPDVRDDLYDSAEDFYRHFLGVSARMGAADVSRLLHLNRPGLFPILDAPVRVLYADRASEAWKRVARRERPRSGRSYWPVIREDICAAVAWLSDARERLLGANDPIQPSMASLSDVRLWDIVVRSVGGNIR